MTDCLGFIGFGEVSTCLLTGMVADGYQGRTYAYDVNPEAVRKKADRFPGLTVCDSMEMLLDTACPIIVAVPGKADQKLFERIGERDLSGHLFMDLSTALPDEKKRIADLVSAKNGAYVDVAVLGSIPKLLHRTPMIVSGREADKAVALLEKYGFVLKACGEEVGAASTIKLCRSIFMKGLPALYLEAKRTSDYYGVSEQVFSSINQNLVGQDLLTFLIRLLDGAYKHTERQMEELQECVEMEKNAGVDPEMTGGAIEVFDSIRIEKQKTEEQGKNG